MDSSLICEHSKNFLNEQSETEETKPSSNWKSRNQWNQAWTNVARTPVCNAQPTYTKFFCRNRRCSLFSNASGCFVVLAFRHYRRCASLLLRDQTDSSYAVEGFATEQKSDINTRSSWKRKSYNSTALRLHFYALALIWCLNRTPFARSNFKSKKIRPALTIYRYLHAHKNWCNFSKTWSCFLPLGVQCTATNAGARHYRRVSSLAFYGMDW